MTERILGHQLFYGSHAFLGFASCGSEIETDALLREALRLGKRVFLPRVSGEEMRFYRINSMEELSCGYRGIREPLGGTEEYLYTEEQAEKTLMLMPGAVFDRQKNRLGYGKGFYDRYLQDKPLLQLRTVAVGFQCQLTDCIETKEWDIRPGQVICF